MPLKKDKENTKLKKIVKKKSTITNKELSKTKSTKKDSKEWMLVCNLNNRNRKTIIQTIEISLLIIIFVWIVIIIHKINSLNEQNIIYNWWIKNYKELNSVYKSPEYKKYIENEIEDLKKQLNNKEIN